MDVVWNFSKNTFASLAVRNFRLYFIGQAITLSGTWMQTVAFGWLILQMTGSGTQLGLITALQFLPILFFGPYGGVAADTQDKRRLLYITQIAGMLIALILTAMVFTHTITLFALYFFAFALGTVRLFETPARQTFVSELVGPDLLKNAISLNATANNLARAIGPSIGGILIASTGIASTFLFNALSFVPAIISVYMMRVEEIKSVELQARKSGQIREGLRYVAGNMFLRNTLIMMAVIGTFAYEFQVSLPLLGHQVFGGGASAYAALFAAFGAGAVIGGIFSAGRHSIAPKNFVTVLFLFGASIILTALSPSLDIAIFGMTIVGAFSINVLSMANTMIQLESAPEMRGRVMALWTMAMIGSTPIGGPIVGWVGEYFGARYGLALGGVATLITALFALAALMSKSKRDDVVEARKLAADEALVEHLKVR